MDEKPWNKLAAYLLVTGKGRQEVAALCGVSIEQVITLTHEPWLIKFVLQHGENVSRNLRRLAEE